MYHRNSYGAIEKCLAQRKCRDYTKNDAIDMRNKINIPIDIESSNRIREEKNMKRKQMVRRFLSVVLATITLVGSLHCETSEVRADSSWPSGPDTLSGSVIVMEVNTGTILYEKDADVVHYPASITKIMTTLLALENCDLDDTVFFSSDAVFKNEGNTSHIAREWKEELSLKSTLYAVMLESANECAYATAEHVAGEYGEDYEYFIQMMNDKAASLGCQNTHFNNANGLPDTEHWTTAHDMALIASAAYQNENFRMICKTVSYTITDSSIDREDYTCYNSHKMLRSGQYHYDYCTGGKTGYTDAARNTLVTFAEKDGITLVCVVLDAGAGQQYQDTINLFDYCFENYKALNIAENDQSLIEEAAVDTGILNENQAYIGFDEDAYIILPVSASFEDVEKEMIQDEDSSGIATIRYTYGDKVVGTVNLEISKASVEDSYFTVEETTEDEDEIVVEIKAIYFVIVIGVLAFLWFVYCLIRYLIKNFYVIRHNMQVRKDRQQRLKNSNRRRKRRRKKDAIFRSKRHSDWK